MSGSTRRAALLAISAAAVPAKSACDIDIFVDKGPTVRITVPSIRKEDLIGIVAEFFARGPQGNNPSETHDATLRKLTELFAKASEVTVTLTSGCPRPGK